MRQNAKSFKIKAVSGSDKAFKKEAENRIKVRAQKDLEGLIIVKNGLE